MAGRPCAAAPGCGTPPPAPQQIPPLPLPEPGALSQPSLEPSPEAGTLQWQSRLVRMGSRLACQSSYVHELGLDFMLGPGTFVTICLDPEDIIVGWNRTVEELTGFSGAEVVGSRFGLFMVAADGGGGGDVPRWKDGAGVYDLVLRHKDDERRNLRLLMSTTVVPGEGTRPRGYVLVGHCVSVVVVEPAHSLRPGEPDVDSPSGLRRRSSAEQELQALKEAALSVLPEATKVDAVIPENAPVAAANAHDTHISDGVEAKLETRGRRRWGPAGAAGGGMPPVAEQQKLAAPAGERVAGSSARGLNVKRPNLAALKSFDSRTQTAAHADTKGSQSTPNEKSQTLDALGSRGGGDSSEDKAEPVPFLPFARLTRSVSQSHLLKNITGQEDLLGGLVKNVHRFSGYTNDLASQAITSTKSGLEILQHAPLVHSVLGAGQGVLGAGQGVLSKTVELCSTTSAKELQEFVENANSPIVFVDNMGKVREWNKAAHLFLGWVKSEVQGKEFVQACLPKECQQSVQTILEKALKGQATSKIELQIRTKAGKLVEVLIDAATRRDSQGRVLGAILLMSDMTEVKVQVQQQIVIAKAWAANDAKSRFLATMSHEMRTPLNVVIGNLELLTETHMTAEQEVFTEQISSAASSLLALIDDILDLTRIEAGKLDLQEEQMNVRSVVEQAMDFVAMQAFRKGLEVFTDVPVDVPTIVKGDPIRLHQILVNLLSNAVKFTEKGRVFVLVQAGEEKAGRVKFSFRVDDTGIGISEEGQATLFKRFSQVDSSTSRAFGGAGLGLAVAKQLAELMDGSIGVTSKLGQGSVFWFSANLPVVHGEQDPLPCLPPVSFKPGAIVVSANADLRQLVCNSVKAMGLRVQSVKSLKEGRSLYRSRGDLRVLILCPDAEAEDQDDVVGSPRRRMSGKTSPRLTAVSPTRRSSQEGSVDIRLSLYDCALEGMNILRMAMPLRAFIFCPRTMLSDAALLQGANQLTIVSRPASLQDLRQAVLDTFQQAEDVRSNQEDYDRSPDEASESQQDQDAGQAAFAAPHVPADRTKPILVLETETATKMALKVMLGKMGLQKPPNMVTCPLAAFDMVKKDQVGACIVSGVTGYNFVQEVLKADLPHPPIVFVGAAGEQSRVQGSTHVLTKPVKAQELKACLESIFASEAPVPAHGSPFNRDENASSLTAETRAEASKDTGDASKCEGRRILIVEDHPPNARMLNAMLAKRKYFIDICEDGLQAVNKTAKEDYDCILMDCNMPVMDGWQATAAIRLREKELGHKRTSIVAVTANAMKGDREKCIDAGMDDYLSKPVDRKELYETVMRWT